MYECDSKKLTFFSNKYTLIKINLLFYFYIFILLFILKFFIFICLSTFYNFKYFVLP
jgi:hypothetical protein